MAEKDFIKKKELLFIFILMVFTVLFRAQGAHMPFDTNEGSFAYAAAQMSQGQILYKNIFEHRPPVIMSIYKAAFSMFGQSIEAIRTFTTIYIIAVMLLIYMLARAVWRSAFISMLAAFFYMTGI